MPASSDRSQQPAESVSGQLVGPVFLVAKQVELEACFQDDPADWDVVASFSARRRVLTSR